MKKIFITTIILSLLFFGCNSKSSNSDSDKKAKSENKQLVDDKEETKPKQTETADDYLLLDKLVGKFKIGSTIPFPEASDDYKINKETQTRMTEEGPMEEIVYVVIKQGQELMQLKPKYDYNTGQYTQEIDEIIVSSSIVKTKKGIGVGSTIEEFIAQYPDYKIWYTYVSGMYVIETDKIKAQFILNEKDFIGKLNITGDVITLKKDGFKEGAKVLKIRVI